MNSKLKGIITPIASILIMIFVGIITGLLVESTSNDGWAALGAIIFVFMLTGVILIIELIVGVVLFARKHSDYGLGIIYGIVGMILAGVLFGTLMTVYNSFI